jgi:hypothetical protein
MYIRSMNYGDLKIRVVFFALLFSFTTTLTIYAQNGADTSGVLEIAEIVLPQGEKLKHQKNLYYEVYTSHTNIPTPSHWYKMVFVKDCSVKFSLFPLYEKDTYDVHCFKVSPDMEVCKAISENKLISCNAQRMYKNYNDDEVKNKSDAGFMDYNAIKVNAGDVLYIEVFSTRGKDCGHIFECQTSSSFFVIKLINKMCPSVEAYSSDLTIPTKQYQAIETEKEAIEYLNKTFCKIKENELTVMSIKMNAVKPIFTSGLDFVNYSKNVNEIALEVAKKESGNKTVPEPVAIVPNLPTPPSVPAVVIPKEPAKPLKSTADLEAPEAIVSTADAGTHSRLDLDKVLFSLLTVDLKAQVVYNNELIKEYNAKLKKTKNINERESLTTSIKELKQQNIDLQSKTKEARLKLKVIQQTIAKNKKGKSKNG